MKTYTFIGIGLLAACGNQFQESQGVNDYLLGLPAWSAKYVVRPEYKQENKETDAATGAVVDKAPDMLETEVAETINGLNQKVRYHCTTTHWTLNKNPETIATFALDKDVLWPGALLQGKYYADGVGSLREVPIRQRAPLGVFVDLFNGTSAQTVANPDAASVQQSVGIMVEQAKAAGTGIGGATAYSAAEFSSSDQISLELTDSAKFMKLAELERGVIVKQASSRKTVTAYLVQRAYTVSVVAPQSPARFFNGDFSRALLDEQVQRGTISPDNLPVYISSVTYGRILLLNVSAEGRVTDISAYLQAKLGLANVEGSSKLSFAFKRIQDSLQVQVAGIGTARSIEDVLQGAPNINEYFRRQAEVDEYVPISFTVRNLGDGSLAKVSETTNYAVQNCRPLNADDVVISLLSLQLVNGGSGSIIEAYGELALNNKVAWKRDARHTLRKGDGSYIFLNEGDRAEGVTPENAVLVTRLVKDAPGPRIVGTVKDHDVASADDLMGDFNIEIRYNPNQKIGEPISVPWHQNCGLFGWYNCDSALTYQIDKM